MGVPRSACAKFVALLSCQGARQPRDVDAELRCVQGKVLAGINSKIHLVRPGQAGRPYIHRRVSLFAA